MYRIVAILLLGLLLPYTIWAVPARRISRLVTQSDGSQLTIIQNGDEYLHYLTTSDEIVVVCGEDGNYYYAEIVNSEHLVATSILAHEANARSEREKEFLLRKEIKDISVTLAEIHKARILEKARTRAVSNDRETPCMGEQHILLILVQFADLEFSTENIYTTFYNHCNALNYTAEGGYGSVRDYFIEQSRGLYTPFFDITYPVTLSHNYAYYGANKVNGNDIRPGEMVKEACQKAYEMGVDFSQYDSNGDGYVDIVYIIYAGFGENENQTLYANAIWPHQWNLSSAIGSPLTIDGMRINRYACNNELYNFKQPDGTTRPALDGVGTICHEFSHCLGLPDFYATNGATHFTMYRWDLMDYGCYNNDGLTPIGYSAYERDFMGWMKLVDLEHPGTYSMNALTENGEAYRIYNTGYNSEYYILENRQQSGFDSEIPGHGMLVMHVDYNSYAWEYNTVNNNSSHLRMSYIAADGTYKSTTTDLVGDLYPGTSGNTLLTDISSPATTVFNGTSKFLSKPITNIRESSDGIITFDFLGGSETEYLSVLKTRPIVKIDIHGTIIQIYTEEGNLPVNIYTIYGLLCNSTSTDSNGKLILALQPGLYLVQVAENVMKVIIK